MLKDKKIFLRYVLAGLALLLLIVAAYAFRVLDRKLKRGIIKTDFALDTFVNIKGLAQALVQ